MPGFLVSSLTLLLLLSGSCGSQTAVPKSPWSLQFTTSGGFAGLGKGNLSVSSDGNYGYEERNVQNVRKGCSGTLNLRQLQPISEALAQIQPSGWNKPGLDIAAPDAFGYKLELRNGSNGQTVAMRWHDNTSDQLPADLKQLSDALMQTMKTACWPKARNPTIS